MGNARTRETTLLIVQHPTLKLNSNVLHDTLPLFYFRSHHEPFFPFSLFLSLSPPILFFHPLNFFRRRWEPHEKKKKKETHETPLFSLPCASLITRLSCVPFPFLFFFFFSRPPISTLPSPSLPQIIIIVSSVIITFLRTLSKRGEMYRMFRWNSN